MKGDEKHIRFALDSSVESSPGSHCKFGCAIKLFESTTLDLFYASTLPQLRLVLLLEAKLTRSSQLRAVTFPQKWTGEFFPL
jgi:hypothetical protein